MKKLITLTVLVLQIAIAQAVTLTPLVKPYVADSLMHVSVYENVKIKQSDLPINMMGPNVNFVKEYKVNAKAQENISAKLQQAIDKYSAAGGAKIHIKCGDYYIGNVKLRSNIHLIFEAGSIIRPYSDDPSSVKVFEVGNDKTVNGGKSPSVVNVSIQSVGGRSDVLLAPEVNGFNSHFAFIRSCLVKDFYYANFNIYDHKTLGPSLGFSAAMPNDDNYIGPTNGVIMNLTTIDSHYGYGLIQTQAGRDLKFYNLHGIGGITLRFETGAVDMNRLQFGGVWDIESQNISVANGHAAVDCYPHGMKNGVVHVRDVTALSSGTAYSICEIDGATTKDIKSLGHSGSFAEGSSIYNVTAIFGLNAQIKTKELGNIPPEYIDIIECPGTRAIINNAPAHTCVSIGTKMNIDYDESTFHAIGFKYGNPIRIVKGMDRNDEQYNTHAAFIMKKYNLSTLNSKAPEFSDKVAK